MFMVMSVLKDINVQLVGTEQEVLLSLAQEEEGLAGMVPVFLTEEQANIFAKGKFEVVQVRDIVYEPPVEEEKSIIDVK